MTAHLVHDQYQALCAACGVQLGDALVQAAEQQGIQAFAILGAQRLAGRRIHAVGGIGHGDALAHAFAACLVVHPKHGQSGGLQYVEQVVMLDLGGVKAFAAQVGEHAGHRFAGAGAAGAGVTPAQHIALGQLGVGIALITVEAEVL
ncbi:hypothetical protein SDC9_139852 [bioreactor metagenome]|uniref:Uncharacterized protein n=1 Tax=bioreactor metagenome TaxID=1076179 RepID=A0A645DTQ3_9ZZZZ